MKIDALPAEIERRWPAQASSRRDEVGLTYEVKCAPAVLPELCGCLFLEWSFGFAGLIVEEGAESWNLRYAFYSEREAGFVHVLAVKRR